MLSFVLTIAFIVLMLLAVPVGHGLVIASAIAILWDGNLPLLVVAQQMFQQTQSFPMLALPFFMLCGSLMMGGRLGRELLNFASEFMKRFTGGELSTTVVASTVFGGVSGSAVANASALGSVLIPWQKKCGYPAGALRGQHGDIVRDRHPDSAVDPDDSLLPRQQHQRGGPLYIRSPAWSSHGGRLRRHLLVERKAPRLQTVGSNRRQPYNAPPRL